MSLLSTLPRNPNELHEWASDFTNRGTFRDVEQGCAEFVNQAMTAKELEGLIWDWSQQCVRVADPARTKCRNWTYPLFSSVFFISGGDP